MGKAPQIKEQIRAAREREWTLDTRTGELKPEYDPRLDVLTQSRLERIHAAVEVFD